jgi:hypothetical protein
MDQKRKYEVGWTSCCVRCLSPKRVPFTRGSLVLSLLRNALFPTFDKRGTLRRWAIPYVWGNTLAVVADFTETTTLAVAADFAETTVL